MNRPDQAQACPRREGPLRGERGRWHCARTGPAHVHAGCMNELTARRDPMSSRQPEITLAGTGGTSLRTGRPDQATLSGRK